MSYSPSLPARSVGRPALWPLATALLWGLALASSLTAADLRSRLQREIEALRRESPELGVHVVEAASGAEIVAYLPDRLRIPASNTKLATTAAALDAFGPGHFLETRFLHSGRVENGVLHGDLAVVGGGDPNLSGRHYLGDPFGPLRPWAERLRELGVTEVSGDLLLDEGLFVGPEIHPDWPTDQLDRWYEAPVAALALSDSCVLVRVLPGRSRGMPAEVELVPAVHRMAVESGVRTVGPREGTRVSFGREGGRITLRGQVALGGAGLERWVSVDDPVAHFGAGLQAVLAEAGIRIGGEVRQVDHLPFTLWLNVDRHRSDLLTTLEVVNKRSQNFYAECLVKLLGARRCGEGSWERGTRYVGEFLQAHGVPEAGFYLVDGSGMSRENRFSPRSLTTLLRAMVSHRWGREFLLTLPYAGEAGLKWEERLAEEPYRGNVFAKTGTLNGVSALSGYARGRSGTLYVFSILCNDTRANWRAEKAQDAFVRALVDLG